MTYGPNDNDVQVVIIGDFLKNARQMESNHILNRSDTEPIGLWTQNYMPRTGIEPVR